MHFKGRLELEQGFKQIHITPLVNIMFLLLMFLMFATGFLMQPGIKVNLPKLVTSEVVQYENIEIIVTQENVVYLNGKTISLKELRAFFKQISRRNDTLLIKADKRTSLGKVIEIWEAARSAGLSSVNIATN